MEDSGLTTGVKVQPFEAEPLEKLVVGLGLIGRGLAGH